MAGRGAASADSGDEQSEPRSLPSDRGLGIGSGFPPDLNSNQQAEKGVFILKKAIQKMQTVEKTVNRCFNLSHVFRMGRSKTERSSVSATGCLSCSAYINVASSLMQVKKHVWTSGREDQITEKA